MIMDRGETLELIQMLKALGDDTRIRIINILSRGALCVCEIEEILNITQSNASRHLNKLMTAKLVTYYKEAKFVYYKLDETTMNNHPFIKEIIDKELCKVEKLQEDNNNLKEFKTDGNNCDTIAVNIKNQKDIG